MYAIVKIGGHQYKVEKDQEVFVNKLAQNEGDQVLLDKVLLIDNKGKVTTGAPTIAGAGVTATIVEHMKADKVLVFKKKRRKGYRKLNGHRQSISRIKIEKIEETGAKAPVNKAKAAAPKAETEVAPKEEDKKKAAAPKKEAAPKADTKKAPAAKAAPKAEKTKKEDKGE
ncbi:MAG: 50S ribosomal protein L21 [Flavobacteriales bacterium]|nr:50S ribosomal protein L21 [Flavobacteriales bacterium]